MIASVESKRYIQWARLIAPNSKIRWAFFVLVGLVLLLGRYDWSSQVRSASKRGFFCSAFFLCLLIPLISAIFERLRLRPVWHNTLLALVTLVLSLPYHWVGLEHWSFHQNRPDWFDWRTSGQPRIVWFPQAFWGPPQIPGESLFFALVAVGLFGVGWLYVRARRNDGRPVARSTVAFGTAVILLILAESWMHISLRSPYTYICHFERAPAENYWYQVLLFPNGQGAVNADYFVFRGLEEVFMGTAHSINGMLIRRPFPFYVSSQFSYFINPYYVMLATNVVVWILAVLAVREYVAAHFDRGTAAVAALLTASGPGFIMYVAQPQTYLCGYCAVAFVIWAHWRICGTPNATVRDYALFGGLLALALFTYDLLVLLLYFGGYELLFKKSLRKISVSAGLAIAIYVAFGLLTSRMKSFVHDPRNINYLRLSVTNTISVLHTNPLSLKTYFNVLTGLLANYAWNLSNAFFVFPLLVALIGFFYVNSSARLKLVGLLFLPSFAGVVFLYLGQTYLATLPRFSYIGYPAVYILCGVALWTAARAVGSRWKNGAVAIVLCGVAAHIALTNVDVFGYPWLYYLFYYQSLVPAHFLTR
jgi:hypothetical protein